MTNIQTKFESVLKGKWQTIGLDVQYKLEGKTLYFQCSRSQSDWIYNFKAGVVPYKNMSETFYVHQGFLLLWKSIQDIIKELDFDEIVGYSQGAAIAILAHEDYLYRKGYEPTTTLFGCPKVFWMPSHSVKTRFTKVTRYYGERDFVPMTPPSVLGYRHVGKDVELKGNPRKPDGYPLLDWLSGHSPTEYRIRLQEL